MVEVSANKKGKKYVSPESSVIVDEVLRVRDGDTFYCNIRKFHPLLGQNIGIRIRGIDTPEMSAQNPDVQAIAWAAKEFVLQVFELAAVIKLRNMSRGKYFRIIADVSADGVDLKMLLLQAELAKPYDGKTKPIWE